MRQEALDHMLLFRTTWPWENNIITNNGKGYGSWYQDL